MAVEETGFGVVCDKVYKNHMASGLLYEQIRDKKTIGIIEVDEKKQTIVLAEPVGLLMGIVPSTKPHVHGTLQVHDRHQGAQRHRLLAPSGGRQVHRHGDQDHERRRGRGRAPENAIQASRCPPCLLPTSSLHSARGPP